MLFFYFQLSYKTVYWILNYFMSAKDVKYLLTTDNVSVYESCAKGTNLHWQ